MSDNRPADIQRRKVEEAEESVYQGLKFDTLAEGQAFVDKVVATKFWTQRVPLIRKVKVDNHDKSTVEIMRHGFMVYIKLPKWGMREMVLLSSLAKMTVPKEQSWNGRECSKFTLQLVKRFMGTMQYEDLRSAYKTHGVRFAVRKKKVKT